MEFEKIWEGWSNHLFPKKEIKEFILQTSKDRLEICKGCEFNSSPGQIHALSRCLACGCPLLQKSKCLSCTCGIKDYNDSHIEKKEIKWFPIATPEQNQELQNSINNE